MENIASPVHEDSALHCKRLGARSVLRPLLYDDHPRDEMPAAGKKCLRPSYRDGLCIVEFGPRKRGLRESDYDKLVRSRMRPAIKKEPAHV